MSLLDYMEKSNTNNNTDKGDAHDGVEASIQPPHEGVGLGRESRSVTASEFQIECEIIPPAEPYARQWRTRSSSRSDKFHTVSLTKDGKWRCNCRRRVKVSQTAECPHIRKRRREVELEISRAKAQAEEDAKYTVDYVLRCIRDDPYVLDIRFWPNGVTKEEVKTRYESGEWNTNSGHFNYVAKNYYKQKGGMFEALWRTIKETREKSWRQFILWAEREIKRSTQLRNDRVARMKKGNLLPGVEFKDDMTKYYDEWIAQSTQQIEAYRRLLGSLRVESSQG